MQRRKLLVSTGIATLGGLAGCSGLGDTYSGDENTSEDGTSDTVQEESTETAADSITERWNAQVGVIFGSPAVSDGTVYVGSYDGNVYALDLSDGSKQWSFETGSEIRSSPAVVNDTVYIGSNDTNVYALNASDGTEKWRFETFDKVQSSPVVANNTVYIGSGDRSFIEGMLYALDATEGTEKWKFEPDSAVSTQPAVMDDTVYFGARGVYAVNAVEGTQKWKFTTGTGSGGNVRLTVANNTVYCTHGTDIGIVYAVDAKNGTEKWRFGETGTMSGTDNITEEFSQPTVANGMVYLASKNTDVNSNRNENVYALDAADGDEQWAFQAGDAEIRASPIVADDTVYIGNTVGDMYAIDSSTGTEQLYFDLGSEVLSLAAADNTICVGSGALHALTKR